MEFLYISLIIFLDQMSKLLVKLKLRPIGNIDLINQYFSLTYVENRGAAFGIFRGMKFLLVGITSIVILVMIAYLVRNKQIDKWMRVSFILIIAGAMGNLIDRVYLGYVIDFFHFYLKIHDFPVFNIADVSVVIGTIILAINLLFVKE